MVMVFVYRSCVECVAVLGANKGSTLTGIEGITRHLHDESEDCRLSVVVQLSEGLKNSRQIRHPRALYWIDVGTE
jgi:hypothetical protein